MTPDIAKKEKKRLYDIEYNKKNKEHKYKIRKVWKEKNKEKISDQNRKWYRLNRKEKSKKNPQYYLWYTARTRARKFKIPFTITPDDINVVKHCPITGNKLVVGDGYNPDSVSLDKINNSKGYIKGNVRVISRWANLKKSDLDIETCKKLIKYMKGEI